MDDLAMHRMEITGTDEGNAEEGSGGVEIEQRRANSEEGGRDPVIVSDLSHTRLDSFVKGDSLAVSGNTECIQGFHKDCILR